MKGRRYDIDWLRVIAMFCVFIFHCTRFFDTEDWHLKAAASGQSDLLSPLRGFVLWVWLMELFFLVSGFAAFYALRHRSGGQYLVERVKRLLIPLYTVGMLIIVVPQAYFERFSHGYITGTFWEWLPGFYRGLPGEVFGPHNFLDPIQVVLYTFSGHLWFIQMLFIISLVTLPLILFFKSERGQRLTDRLAGWSTRPGGIFLFVIPLALVRVGLMWLPVTTDRTWADFLWYAFYFLIGFILASDDRYTEAIKKHGWICLALWVVLFMGVGGFITFGLNYDTSAKGPGFSGMFVIWQITYSIISWSSVVFLLSLGAKYLNFSNKLLAYSSEAVLPFYLFHQTIILIVGWFVLPLDTSSVVKFLIIALVSFPIILILYEVFVRRIGFMRFLFGMAPKTGKNTPQ
jgi:glucans biosynthesis protein C